MSHTPFLELFMVSGGLGVLARSFKLSGLWPTKSETAQYSARKTTPTSRMHTVVSSNVYPLLCTYPNHPASRASTVLHLLICILPLCSGHRDSLPPCSGADGLCSLSQPHRAPGRGIFVPMLPLFLHQGVQKQTGLQGQRSFILSTGVCMNSTQPLSRCLSLC